MRAILFRIFIALKIATAQNSEWVPIPNTVAIRHFNYFPRTNVSKTHHIDLNIDIEVTEKPKTYDEDVIKLIHPIQFYGQFASKDNDLPSVVGHVNLKPAIPQECGGLGLPSCPRINMITEGNISNELSITANIQADRQGKEVNDNVFTATGEKQEDRTAYEVTEKLPPYIGFMADSSDLATAPVSKRPRSSVENDSSENYFTNSLLKILEKYNIRSKDNLSNYRNSRTTYNPVKPKYAYLPIPIKHSRGYYNHNHYPVDPSLAALLTAYGNYLSNYFRPRNNYQHLATSRILNKLLFDTYKTFSDTDFSH